MFGIEDLGYPAPDSLAVPVELQRGHLLDRFAFALVSDQVVALRRIKLMMVHELAQHINVDSGVGMASGVGVSVGIGEDLRLVEWQQHPDLRAVRLDERGYRDLRQCAHPCSVLPGDPTDGLLPGGVCPLAQEVA